MYSDLIKIYYSLNTNRESIPNYLFFIKKIIHTLYSGIDEEKKQAYSKVIFIQRENTINKINKKWNDICKHVDLSVYKNMFKQ